MKVSELRRCCWSVMMLLGNSQEKRWAVLCWRNCIRQTNQLVLHYTRHDLGFWCLGNVAGGGYKAYDMIGSV